MDRLHHEAAREVVRRPAKSHRCTNGSCQNMVCGKFKMCLACRLYRRACMERYYRKREEKKAKEPPKQKGWTNEKWLAFVNAGGLEGL